MLNVSNWGSRTTLSMALSPTDVALTLPVPDNALFMVPAGDHVYVTVRDGAKFERMRVTGSSLGKILVDRAQDGTTAKAFGIGSCVTIDWNPLQLCEYIRNCMSGTETPCILPQTVCMDCNTCLELSAEGRIISVNKGTGIC